MLAGSLCAGIFARSGCFARPLLSHSLLPISHSLPALAPAIKTVVQTQHYGHPDAEGSQQRNTPLRNPISKSISSCPRSQSPLMCSNGGSCVTTIFEGRRCITGRPEGLPELAKMARQCLGQPATSGGVVSVSSLRQAPGTTTSRAQWVMALWSTHSLLSLTLREQGEYLACRTK